MNVKLTAFPAKNGESMNRQHFLVQINIFIAVLLSIISTLIIVFSIIMILHMFCTVLYMKFTNEYNTNTSFMLGFVIGVFGVFIVLMCFIFIKRINTITDYIEEISLAFNDITKFNVESKTNSHEAKSHVYRKFK